MEYKKSARSPHYGKIYGYDLNGKEIEELDILQIMVMHQGRDYRIGDILNKTITDRPRIIELEKETKELKEALAVQLLLNKSFAEKQELQTKLLILMDARVKVLELK